MSRVFSLLRSYIDAAMERDPAARSRLEVALPYPGVHALSWHILAHWLYLHGARGLARDCRSWCASSLGSRSIPAPPSEAACSSTTAWEWS